jgi:CRP-like cAMP-binding protein
MALMTGEPRSATVIARTEVNCYRLSKESFRQIIASRPAVAEEIAALLAERQTQLTAIVQNLNAAEHSTQITETRNDLLRTIRRFFGLTSGT